MCTKFQFLHNHGKGNLEFGCIKMLKDKVFTRFSYQYETRFKLYW